LQAASVFGQRFSPPALRFLLDQPAYDCAPLLDQFLVRPHGEEFRFKHALVRDAAYHSLLKSRRAEVHRRIAEALRCRSGKAAEPQPELLAFHYAEAGLTEQAIRHWRRAGERSVARFANREAVGHFRRALESVEALPPGTAKDRLEAELRLDAKEVAEHIMLVDLARNDVARICAKGERRVARLMNVERYARVMHLVSSVKGPLAEDRDSLHALQACLNVGTLSGAPKIRATELIRETEATKRGPYGGAVGWLNGEGDMDTGVIIRSALVKDGRAYIRAGAGIVHDSDPQAEAAETKRKAAAILSAIASAEAGPSRAGKAEAA